MAYANYAYYTAEYMGNSIPSANFDRLANRASSYLDKIIGSKISEISTTEKVKMATCAVAEAWQINENGGDVVSQSVGSWSKSFNKESKSDDQRLFEAANLYLYDVVRKVRWC
ncbi:MAG: hypothetical protein ACK5MV_07610 [Aminipila sp.]